MLIRVRRARLERGLSQKEVARIIDVSPQALSRVEGGHLVPWPRLRKQLSRLYRIEEAELFSDLDRTRAFLREMAGEVPVKPSLPQGA